MLPQDLARLGVDGFGYASSVEGHTKVPQVGACVIEDDVEIGANCAIDRGTLAHTEIGAGQTNLAETLSEDTLAHDKRGAARGAARSRGAGGTGAVRRRHRK